MHEPLYGTPRRHHAPLGPLAPVLVRSTTAGQPDAEALRRLGAAEQSGEFYQRLGHHNGRAVESLCAELEGADGAVAFASGMAAMSAALSAHLKTGDRVLLAEQIYGGTSAFALTDDVPARVKTARRNRIMRRQKKLVAARQKTRLGQRSRIVVDGPASDHDLVLRGRLATQAPDIDASVYLTECDPSAYRAGDFVDVEIVGAREYDLLVRPVGE